ncbi:anhydro-N-acetylmuramic acid kinase [Halorarum halobium]|uniref:anhydro-N-acetylmuramic acid kinase n=1 Tax=Halorarum halobium TaxID=3075121 RepID=UPI0028AC0670|nr:anhydro-N-acetylmuramic acid kinase [Halobaculum sp. XH14]
MTEPHDTIRAVGLMSGTSLDGVDGACCTIDRTATDDPFGYDVTLESFVTVAYPPALRDRLVAVCDDETGTVDDVCRLNVGLCEVLADVAERAWTEAGHERSAVDVIGSHGQTIWHIPAEEPVPGYERASRSTLQIGDGSVLSARTGVPTVSDFRMRDVAAGGHGAPLAPFMDATRFAGESAFRAVQNVGGIGNCTLLPPNPTMDNVTAFDTGPGNMVIDAVVELLTDGAETYDVDGELAARGSVDEGLLETLLADDYFAEAPPKSTGREYFGHEYARTVIEAGRERGLDDEDIVATATMLTAASIDAAYRDFADRYPDEIYVCGGGASNPTLLEFLRTRTDAPVARLQELGMDADAKEAAMFALFAATNCWGEPNNVPSATGADGPVSMGKVSRP